MFEESDEARKRRMREVQARAKSEDTRRLIVGLLSDGPLSGREIKRRLPADIPMSLLNYHLAVLVEAEEIVNEAGTYRLA